VLTLTAEPPYRACLEASQQLSRCGPRALHRHACAAAVRSSSCWPYRSTLCPHPLSVMMDFFETESSQLHEGKMPGGSIDSVHVVPTDPQWGYSSLLNDPLLDASDLFTIDSNSHFDTLNDLFTVPTGESRTPDKGHIDEVLHKRSSDEDVSWDTSGWATKALTDVVLADTTAHQCSFPPHVTLNPISVAPRMPLDSTVSHQASDVPTSMKLKLIKKQGQGDSWSVDANPNPRLRSKKRRTSKGQTPQKPIGGRAAPSSSTASAVSKPAAACKSSKATRKGKSRRLNWQDLRTITQEGQAHHQTSHRLPTTASGASTRAPLRERNSPAFGERAPTVALASLVDIKQLPIVIHRTVPVSFGQADDTHSHGDLTVPRKLGFLVGPSLNLTQQSEQLVERQCELAPLEAGASVPIFTKEIVGTAPVIKPNAQRVDRDHPDLTLRRRRGMTPLKIVHPEAILKAAFSKPSMHAFSKYLVVPRPHETGAK